MQRSPLEPLVLRVADLQIKRPILVLALAALSLLPAGWATSTLTLETAFSELLPENKPSVIEMHRVRERIAGASTLTVVGLGDDVEALKKLVDTLAPRIAELPPEWVVGVDSGTREVRSFFERHKHLYADLKDIQEIHDDVVERYDYEVGKKTGFDLGLEEEGDDAPPKITAEDLEKRFQKKVDEAKKNEKGVDGYYIGGTTQKLAAILVTTPLSSGSDQAFELQARIRALVDEIDPTRFHPSLEVAFTGNLVTSAEQHRTVTTDLAHVGIWGVGLILGIVFLFFLRVRVLLCMTVTIALGCTWAFGLAALTVGYLNTATGFLASIVAGNGINFGIIYMARYMEARRDQKLDVPEAVRTAHRDTHLATLAASSAAMVAYGSLAATDFRGFRHFGIICGSGMLLCWLATYLVLPAILVASERIAPMFQDETKWTSRVRGVYGYPFVWLAAGHPRAVAVAGIAVSIASGVLAYRYLADDPMEYDLKNIRNERVGATSAGRLSTRVDKVVGRLKQDGKAIVTERIDQVAPLVAELERRRTEGGGKAFERTVSLFDLLPSDQEAKIELLETIKDRLERGKKRGFVTDADWKKLEPHVPASLKVLGPDDLPEQIARPFTERDGTRGRIVYIEPKTGRSVYDARYLMLWADTFREVKLPNGDVVRGTGDPVIFSDMLINIREDAPTAILLSFLGTVAVFFLAFRGKAVTWLALVTLVAGLAWLMAFLALRGIKLNFLNFVALPISIGVGADYAINVLGRREIEGDDGLAKVFVETGGAVVLCSLTTTLGYLALLFSINGAVRSFGLAAAVGELTTLVSAMLVLPAVLFWRASRKRRDGESAKAP